MNPVIYISLLCSRKIPSSGSSKTRVCSDKFEKSKEKSFIQVMTKMLPAELRLLCLNKHTCTLRSYRPFQSAQWKALLRYLDRHLIKTQLKQLATITLLSSWCIKSKIAKLLSTQSASQVLCMKRSLLKTLMISSWS